MRFLCKAVINMILSNVAPLATLVTKIKNGYSNALVLE